MHTIQSAEALQTALTTAPAAALYFSGASCPVCHALKPKLDALLAEEFPRLERFEVESELHPELAAAYSVFTLPVLILFFDGREGSRFARSFSLGEVRAALARPYSLLFGE